MDNMNGSPLRTEFVYTPANDLIGGRFTKSVTLPDNRVITKVSKFGNYAGQNLYEYFVQNGDRRSKITDTPITEDMEDYSTLMGYLDSDEVYGDVSYSKNIGSGYSNPLRPIEADEYNNIFNQTDFTPKPNNGSPLSSSSYNTGSSVNGSPSSSLELSTPVDSSLDSLDGGEYSSDPQQLQDSTSNSFVLNYYENKIRKAQKNISDFTNDLLSKPFSLTLVPEKSLLDYLLKANKNDYLNKDFSAEWEQWKKDKNIPSSDLRDLDLAKLLINDKDPQHQLIAKDLVSGAYSRTSEKLSKIFENSSDELSFEDKFKNTTFGKHYDMWSAGLDATNTALTGILGEKSEYSGPKGDITKGLDSAYDTISNAIAAVPGFGLAASLIMKGNKALGTVMNKVGGGTSGRTTVDAILGSSFFNMTPLGLVNGFAGSKTSSFTKDDDVFALLGNSYLGSLHTADDAVEESSQKYGLLSSHQRKKANREIEEAARLQEAMTRVADKASKRFAIRNSNSAINGNRRRFAMSGGYKQLAVRAGRSGLSLKNVMDSKRIISAYKFKRGGKNVDPFEAFVSTLPNNLKPTKDGDYDVRRYWELHGRPKNFLEAVKKGMYTKLADGWHANTVAYNELTGEYEFMKSKNHPSLHYELEWYNSDDPEAIEFRKEWELDTDGEYYKYIRRSDPVEEFKQGGIIHEVSLDTLPEFKLGGIISEVSFDSLFPLVSIIKEVSFEELIPEYKEGGKVNVIPEGALHARLHHMENADNLTKKGIPVVSEGEGGELEQQAEIERLEIIFRISVTEQLEEYKRKYESDKYSLKEKDAIAIEAGKLLVYEILNNTIDNTNSLL